MMEVMMGPLGGFGLSLQWWQHCSWPPLVGAALLLVVMLTIQQSPSLQPRSS